MPIHNQHNAKSRANNDACPSPSARFCRVTPDIVFERDQSGITGGLREGCYLYRRQGHVSLPVRVWWGPPPDLETDQKVEHGDRYAPVMDRSPRWNIEIAGVLAEDERSPRAMARLADVWPRCLLNPTSEAECRYRLARIVHARQHSPTDPFGQRFGRVDLFTAPPPF